VFFYEATAYIEGGDFRDRLVGNAPVVVDHRGRLHETGTAYPLDYYLTVLALSGAFESDQSEEDEALLLQAADEGLLGAEPGAFEVEEEISAWDRSADDLDTAAGRIWILFGTSRQAAQLALEGDVQDLGALIATRRLYDEAQDRLEGLDGRYGAGALDRVRNPEVRTALLIAKKNPITAEDWARDLSASGVVATRLSRVV
jgi:hypothetical protein